MSFRKSIHIAPDGSMTVWNQLPFGETAGRNEAWLRDTLQAHPELIPMEDLDPAYGPLIPVCTELKTDAGFIDNVFINHMGRLTLVECKLWKSAEARRKVVAQILDYAKELGKWSATDLAAKVQSRLGPGAPNLFGVVSTSHPGVQEQKFNDGVTRSLSEGRFQLLIAGDGIKDDVKGIADLINKNATSAFSLGLFQVELHQDQNGALLVQGRAIARTQLVQRTVIIVQDKGKARLEAVDFPEDEGNENVAPSAAQKIHTAAAEWWAPILSAGLENREQEPFRYYWPHNIRGVLPWAGTWITAYRSSSGSQPVVGVFVGGRNGAEVELLRALESEWLDMRGGLPEGTVFDGQRLQVVRPLSSFSDEDEARRWLTAAVNQFVNELRPRALVLAKA